MLKNLIEAAQCSELSVAYLFQWCVGFRIGQGGNKFLCGGGGSVDCGNTRDLGVLQEKFDGVSVLLDLSVGDVDTITSIMFQGRAKIPAINAMGRPL